MTRSVTSASGWSAALEARGRKASTLAAYESTLRGHLVPHFGEGSITRITVEDVEGVVAACRAKGSAPKSIRNYLGTLHAIFECARSRPNPVTDARKPEAEDTDPDIHFLVEEELEALLRAVPDDHLGPTDRALYLNHPERRRPARGVRASAILLWE